MLTVRVSPMEVQVDVQIYTFNDVAMADSFEASAQAQAQAQARASANPEFIRRKCLAIGCRPVDCDHEVGRF